MDGASDVQIRKRIGQLVGEETGFGRPRRAEASEGDRRRLDELKVTLDRCWDLRQRRALEEFGLDADAARGRPPEVLASATSSSDGQRLRHLRRSRGAGLP